MNSSEIKKEINLLCPSALLLHLEYTTLQQMPKQTKNKKVFTIVLAIFKKTKKEDVNQGFPHINLFVAVRHHISIGRHIFNAVGLTVSSSAMKPAGLNVELKPQQRAAGLEASFCRG